MKYSIISCIILSLLLACSKPKNKAQSSVLFPYYQKTGGMFAKFKYKAGYMDLSGNRVIEPEYIFAAPFTEGLGCVSVNTDSGVFYGYIDSTANFIIKPVFKRARPFQNGRALVWDKANKGWGVIDNKGNFLTERIFTLATDYYKGHCLVYIKQGTQEASDFEKIVTGIFTLGLAQASDHTVYNCYQLDLAGKATLVEANTTKTDHKNFIEVRMQNNLAKYWRNDNKFGFKRITVDDYEPGKMNYRNEGTVFIEPIYENAQDFEYGYARVIFENNDKGYIDTNGRVVLRFKEDRPY